MASQNDMLVGRLNEMTKSISIASSTVVPAIVIQYCGPKAYAKVQASSGDLLFTADDVDGTTADTTIGWTSSIQATGTIDLTTPDTTIDTFGELADIINNKFPNWRCFLVGVLPSQLTNTNIIDLAATAANVVGGVTLYFALSRTFAQGITGMGASITNEKFTGVPKGGWATKHVGWTRNKQLGANPANEVVNSICYLEHTTAATNAGYVKFYGVDEVDGTTVLLYTHATIYTTATAQQIGTSPTPDAIYVSAPAGMRLVIWVSVVDTHPTAFVLTALGKTKHRFGGEVPLTNYTGCA